MGYWNKHPKKDGQDALEEFHRLGWRIGDPPKYYQVKCPCGWHMTHVHISPSNPNHYRQRLQWAKRQSCTKEEDQ
ncbi:hypothetical protein [Nocardiopsis sp. LOL_012]|uniref:hypothetical protein n=1 Tax=Nocardiopsis sp. LOL_012 TaxID=3345409 RepID=UPI003A83B2F8